MRMLIYSAKIRVPSHLHSLIWTFWTAAPNETLTMLPLLVLFITLIISYLGWFFYDEFRKKQSLPPGPPVLPFLGSVVSIALADSQPHLALVKLAKKYGDIMRLRMGAHEYVVLSSSEVINEMLSMDESLGRPNHGVLRDLQEIPNTGVITAWGEPWRLKRNWTVRIYREMGLGRTSYFEETTRSALNDLHGTLRSNLPSSGKVLDVSVNCELCAMSLMWTVLVGSNTPQDHADCQQFLHVTDKFASGAALGAGLVIIAPFMKYVAPGLSNHTNVMNFATLSRQLGQKLYNTLIKLKSPSEPQNFFHAYILELQKGRTGFSETDFRMTFLETLAAALETTNGFLQSLILFLTLYPEKQETLHEEISSNFPPDHVFTIADLKAMPYTQAFMVETHRHAIIIPNGLPRTLTSDVTYRGFTFKQGTTCLMNYHASFKSPDHFGPDPEAFRPERFIDPTDPSKLSELRKLVTPFSIGKRSCPGESVAQIVSFLTLVSTVRNFRLSAVPSEPPPTQSFDVGLTTRPYPFRVLVLPRQ